MSFSKSYQTVSVEMKLNGNNGCWNQMNLKHLQFQIMKKKLTLIQILVPSFIFVLSVRQEKIELYLLQDNLLRKCLVKSMQLQLLINFKKSSMNLCQMCLFFIYFQLVQILLILSMNLVKKRRLLLTKLVWEKNKKLKQQNKLTRLLLTVNGLF